MKSNGLTTILNAVLAVTLLGCVFLSLQHFFLKRDFRRLNMEVTNINVRRSGVQALAADCVEYSKRNPAILPILQSVGIGKQADAGAAKPAK